MFLRSQDEILALTPERRAVVVLAYVEEHLSGAVPPRRTVVVLRGVVAARPTQPPLEAGAQEAGPVCLQHRQGGAPLSRPKSPLGSPRRTIALPLAGE